MSTTESQWLLLTAEQFAAQHIETERKFYGQNDIYLKPIEIRNVLELPEPWTCPSGARVGYIRLKDGLVALHSKGCGPANIFRIDRVLPVFELSLKHGARTRAIEILKEVIIEQSLGHSPKLHAQRMVTWSAAELAKSLVKRL
jgi:hypothetical protein